LLTLYLHLPMGAQASPESISQVVSKTNAVWSVPA